MNAWNGKEGEIDWNGATYIFLPSTGGGLTEGTILSKSTD